MNKNKKLNLEPYTSIVIGSLKEAGDLLENILSSDYESQPRKIDKPVILYGTGSLGKMAKDFFDYLKIPFLYAVDKNASKYRADAFWQKTKIILPNEVEEVNKNNSLLVICIVTTPMIALRDELKNSGWKNIAFFYDLSEAYRNQHPLNNGWFVSNFNKKEKESIRKVFSLLADNTSHAHYVQFLAWRKLRVELLFSDIEINNNNRFFIPEIINALGKNEVFVDCGAHYGSTTRKFLNMVDNKYKEIYAIEPDNINFRVLKRQLRNIPNTTLIKCALSDKNGKERFCQGFNFVSKLNKKGDDLVRIITLDSLNILATFIKMHLEGGDLKALKGAVNTIQKYRPIIAVTIYHNTDGVWETPFFLMSSVENYKYYMRLHSWGGTGAVFYAIPKERIIK